jgi:hypothetical protein
MRQHAAQIEIVCNAAAVAERAAARGVARLHDRHAITPGFAAGATMRPLYARLACALRLHHNVHILGDEPAAVALANRPHNANRRTA